MNGFIVIDKPEGMTSHDVVNRIRRITGQKKAGHTGTLDPFATGVLPVALGEATKAIPFLDESIKEYRATLLFGRATDTQDYTGAPVLEGDWTTLDSEAVQRLAVKFLGKQQQCPPMFSALKHQGTPLYKLARRGIEIERPSREVEIHALSIEAITLPEVSFTVRCSRGTYVRTLAHDLGMSAGCGAHLLQLRRTASGPFRIEDALSLETVASLAREGKLSQQSVTVRSALNHLTFLTLSERGVVQVRHGIIPDRAEVAVSSVSPAPGDRLVLAGAHQILAVAEVTDLEQDQRAEAPLSMRFLRVFNDLCLYRP
ncbi:tRNA pseudouridine(55) synthase TruB [Geobacter sp. DSM 9736]|uniref:tRNA pseudouridine(55) synthase TruB n=1 Tax=Geobacter sp. DSM 9736 TaxID=1277350 RepID=UPI000B51406B|nr:tRNA pseudouridine(55) synthase TruB [Geobacter sp. DSM 9736]SNB45655.1 tRNA pseudouridine synthase B [Geobacter sp. DSM 9736]